MMYVLDSDHLSLLERADHPVGRRLRDRLRAVPAAERGTTIVNYEEQVRGWLAYLARSRSPAQRVAVYERLRRQLRIHCKLVILDFNDRAAEEYERLRRAHRRAGAKDLQVAAVVLAHDATLLTRNRADFEIITDLRTEDWTA